MTFSRPIRRRRRLRERAGFRAAFAIVASLAANALVVAFLSWAGAFDAPRGPAVARPVALAPLSSKDWAANRAIATPGQRPPPPAAKPQAQPSPPSPLQGQIVELPPGAADANPKPPKDSRYLSDRDRTVDKETVSRYAGNQRNLTERPQAASPGSAAAGAGGKPGQPAPKPAPPQQQARAETTPQPPSPQPAPKPAPPQRQQHERAEPPRKEGSEDGRLALAPKLDELGRSPSAQRAEPAPRTPAGKAESNRSTAEPGRPAPPSPTPSPRAPPQEEGIARAPGPQRPDLSVSPDTVARIGGGPGMAGYNEAEEGDITALNTRDGGATARWGMRLQRQIGNEWDRLVMRAVRERDPGGEIFFYKERSVVLTVVLDPSGNLRDVSVLRSSNIEFFDETAIAAVRKAQPFEAPPSTFVVAGGTATFPFKFVLFPARRSLFSIGQPER